MFLLITGGTASAIAPTLIVTCQVIDTPGFYEVETPIVTSTVRACIDITAAGVTLSLNSSITGDGTHGIGIHIEHGATGAVIQGWGPAVSSFDTGVVDSQGGSVMGGFPVTNNNTTGLLLDHANGDICDNITANNNGHDGIHIMQTMGARVNAGSANSNGTYGVWIDGSSHTVLDKFTASANGTTNVEIGSPSGAQSGSANILDEVHVDSAPFGVVIEKGDTGNIVTQTGVGTGKTPASTDDAMDKNPACKMDHWFNNFFKKRKPNCVH